MAKFSDADPQLRRKLHRCQTQAMVQLCHVHLIRAMRLRRNRLPLSQRNSLLKPLRHTFKCIAYRFFSNASETSTSTSFARLLRPAFVRLACSFLPNTVSKNSGSRSSWQHGGNWHGCAKYQQIESLRVPPGNCLEALRGDRNSQYRIRINDQWRICFQFEDG